MFVRSVLHHRDDVDQRLVVAELVGLLEQIDGEALWGRGQLGLQLGLELEAALPWQPQVRDQAARPVVAIGGQQALGAFEARGAVAEQPQHERERVHPPDRSRHRCPPLYPGIQDAKDPDQHG